MSTPAAAEPNAPAGIGAGAPGIAADSAGAAGHTRPSASGPATCANCGALLAGRYCSECGQRHHEHPVHDFWHFVSEALEDLTHADSRLWRTLTALLFRPGLLTREFLDGRRVRYLPPVRLYLVVSLIFFVIVGIDAQHAKSYVVLSAQGKSLHYQVVPADAERPASAVAGAPARPAAGNEVSPLPVTPKAQQQACARTAAYARQKGGWIARLAPRLGQSCLTVLASGGVVRFNEIAQRNLERAMFLFLPLLALALKPLYLRPPRHYIEHLLFFLHSHAFLFAVLGASTLVGLIISSPLVLEPIDLGIALYIPIYFYLAMRRVYGQGRWLTLSKLTALAVVYSCLGIALIAATYFYSFLML